MKHNPDPLKFRIRYIILPLVAFLAVVALAAAFFGQLPDEVFYRFGIDGTPSGDPTAKTGFILMMLGVQAALLFVAWLTVRTIGNVRLFHENIDSFWFDPAKLLTIMGNLPVIIQLILGYILVDAVVYAANESHLMPLWLFALIVLVVGGIALLAYGVPVVLQAYRGFNQLKDNKKE